MSVGRRCIFADLLFDLCGKGVCVVWWEYFDGIHVWAGACDEACDNTIVGWIWWFLCGGWCGETMRRDVS
jgi:hypothetical protein